MRKFFVRLVTLFIPVKSWRKKIRLKYEKPRINIDVFLNNLNSKINDINYKQNLIMDYFIDVKSIKKATGAQRIRQEENVILLKEFIRLCEIHHLRYWLDYGSLLGAIRHGFTIPWDDDLDVSMPADEFDKFEEIIKNDIDKNIKYIKVWNNWQSRLIFKNDTGAFLDIYAYEEYEDRLQGRPKFKPKSYNRSIPKDIVFPVKRMKFENVLVDVPNDSDTYLRIKYGNYLTLPKSEHKEIGHNPVQEYINFYNEP